MGSPAPVRTVRPSDREIELSSGGYYHFEANDPWSFTLDDLAHAGNVCRFAGQCREFYSVAQHQYLGAEQLYIETGDKYLAGLFLVHDAHEALVLDMATPMKRVVQQYKVIERNAEATVRHRLMLPLDFPHAIKTMDIRMFATERDQLMPCYQELQVCVGVDRVPITIDPWLPADARRRWKELFWFLFLDGPKPEGFAE